MTRRLGIPTPSFTNRAPWHAHLLARGAAEIARDQLVGDVWQGEVLACNRHCYRSTVSTNVLACIPVYPPYAATSQSYT